MGNLPVLKEQQNTGKYIHIEEYSLAIYFHQKASERIQSDLRKALPEPGYQCDSVLKNSISIDCFECISCL